MLKPGSSIHVLGACGTAMATFAAMLAERGHRVRGSDQNVYPPMSELLQERGIELRSPYDAANLDPEPDLVVVGNAIPRGNPEMEEILDRGLIYRSFPELFRDEFLQGKHAVVISGTHGKTTTTAMAALAMRAADLSPSALVGGYIEDLGGSYILGEGKPFVVEGDEYDTAYFDKTPKFLKYQPRTLVVNNLEFDHADIYDDLDAIVLQFRRLVHLVPRSGIVLVGDCSPTALEVVSRSHAKVERFGLGGESEWRAVDLADSPEGASFTVRYRGEELGRASTPFSGEHNVRNALAAVASSHHQGADFAKLARGLAEMRPVRRRLELKGTEAGVLVYDDFAHHPTAVRETLRSVRARHPGRRIVAVFEPRSWTSRRKVHQEGLTDALSEADRVVLAPVFEPERLAEDIRLDPLAVVRDLEAREVSACVRPGAPEIAAEVASKAKEGDVVVVMSNGAFGGVHGLLLERLRA